MNEPDADDVEMDRMELAERIAAIIDGHTVSLHAAWEILDCLDPNSND